MPSILHDDTLLGPDATAAASLPSSQPRVPRLLPGSAIGHYEVVAHLGAGGMGTVYRARDQRLGREVALKLRPPNAEGQTTCRVLCSLLGREAKVMASLSHPNLVQIFDVGEHRGCVFLAIELVDGATLREWASGRAIEDRRRALRDAGRGLAAAHAAGVIHRDFKPENVLVSSKGQVKVADFGLARSKGQILEWGVSCGGCTSDDASGEIAASVDDSIAGTPRYMAPPQLDGAPADERSDQFAFAVTAWELLFDSYPFPATTIGELRAAVAAGPTAPPDPVDRAMAAVLRRALAPDPAARFSSMEELLDALVR
ncbi:MAG TPA: serine/threonine-protein kinase [Kofleriaceae bacterium]|nr:serine/threonine-protein kinase [Kofleriaceae bacterium]